MLAGVCMALGTMIHPSNEAVQTIIAQESRLIIGHWLLTFYCAFLLLGLSGIYMAYSRELGGIGLAGFLLLFFGTVFYAVSSDYGFNAPVLAKLAPAMLAAINAYLPVAVMDGLMILCMFPGFILFGIAIQRSGVLPAWSGILIATGWPLFIITSAISLLAYPPAWILAIFGSILAGAGLAWAGYSIWSVSEQRVLQTVGC
jgi:hypothetical protein